jgi:hypothetical protein
MSPLMAISFIFLQGVFKLAFNPFQFGNEVGISFQKDLLGIVLGNHVFQFGAAFLIAF